MTYIIKKIESDLDKEKTKKLWQSHKKWEGSYMLRSDEEIEKVLCSQTTQIYGSFDIDDKLLATITLIVWSKIPCYILNGHCIEKNIMKLYNFKNKNPMSPLINYVVTMMESREYYTFYYTQAITPGIKRQYRTDGDMFRNIEAGWDSEKNQYRYDRYFEEIISPESKSKYEIFNEMIDNKEYRHNIGVVKYCLKPEYRPWPDVFIDGDKYFIKNTNK
jgi:hypothetical protein